jgi:SAM-dependent methyltransferase
MNENYFYKSYTPKNLESIPCSVCSSDDFHLVAEENNLNIVRCSQCGYILVNPRPSSSDLEDFYQEYYPDQEGLPQSWGGEMSEIFSSTYRQIDAGKDGGRILDIGSSYGHFLSQFETSKWKATGIDPSPTAVAYCNEKYPHITAHVANFEDVFLEPESFDVITSFYVLEHVFDPRDVMQRIHTLLDQDGLAIIRIPYTKPFFPFARMLGRPLMYAPMHLNDFAPSHFERMCRDVGFSEVKTTIGARRNSSDLVEKLGALVFGGAGQIYEALIPGSSHFPFAGAYTYVIAK